MEEGKLAELGGSRRRDYSRCSPSSGVISESGKRVPHRVAAHDCGLRSEQT